MSNHTNHENPANIDNWRSDLNILFKNSKKHENSGKFWTELSDLRILINYDLLARNYSTINYSPSKYLNTLISCDHDGSASFQFLIIEIIDFLNENKTFIGLTDDEGEDLSVPDILKMLLYHVNQHKSQYNDLYLRVMAIFSSHLTKHKSLLDKQKQKFFKNRDRISYYRKSEYAINRVLIDIQSRHDSFYSMKTKLEELSNIYKKIAELKKRIANAERTKRYVQDAEKLKEKYDIK